MAVIGAVLLGLAQAGAPSPPPLLHPLTIRSGGLLEPDRAPLRLDSVVLAVEVLPDRRMLSGRAVLGIRAASAVPRLTIDLDTALRALAVSLDGTALPVGSWRHTDGRVVIDHGLAAGATASVTITYAGTPHVARRAPWDDGFVWSESGGKPWFGTTAQGYGCDLWWPCLDFPAGEPARVDLHITIPTPLSAPANGILLNVVRRANGRSTWHWRSGPINSYALAIAAGPYRQIVGNYESKFGNTIPMSFWHLAGKETQAARLFSEFAPTLRFFEELIGPYPFGREKLGLVETPYLGMEHQTINAYGNNYTAAPEGFDWLFHHELAHEWFGNQLTATDWDDFWLHEGFAQYMQPLYAKWREGDARYLEMLLKQRVRIENKAPIVSGRPLTASQVASTKQGGPDTDVYYKGAWVLHTLRGLIGDRAFFQATRRLVYGRADPRPGNFAPRFGTTAEFEKLVAEESGRDLTWFFDAYLRERTLPELMEERTDRELVLRWRTAQNRPFPFPVDIVVDGVGQTVPMTGGSGSVAMPRSAHVVIDPMAKILRRSEAIERMQSQAAAR